jgi:hypothetical protein
MTNDDRAVPLGDLEHDVDDLLEHDVLDASSDDVAQPLDDDEPQEPGDDLEDLSPDDYDTAAAQLEATSAQEDDDGEPNSSREARYRIRLREAEQILIDGRDLLKDGADLDVVLDDEGLVDPVKVAALARKVVEDRPHYGRQGIKVTPGFQSGATGSAKPPTNWKSAFAPVNTE